MHFQSHRIRLAGLGRGRIRCLDPRDDVRSLLDGAVLAVKVIYARRSDLHDSFRT